MINKKCSGKQREDHCIAKYHCTTYQTESGFFVLVFEFITLENHVLLKKKGETQNSQKTSASLL